MKLAVIGTGSRGDSRPMMALALALVARGHDVRFLALEDERAVLERLGLVHHVLPGRSTAFFGGPAGTAMRRALTRSPTAYVRFFEKYMGRFLFDQLEACAAACEGVDGIVSWPWLRVAPNVARVLDVPCVIASPTPPLYLDNRAFACPYTRPTDDPGLEIEASWADAHRAFAAGQPVIEGWRKARGGPDLDLDEELAEQRSLPHVLGISPTLLPKPDDWGSNVSLHGHFGLPPETGFRPPPELAAFVARGRPPLGLGFSSNVGDDPRAFWATMGEALAGLDRRAVVVAGYANLEHLPRNERILTVPQVPYTWLLPHLAGFVHHGGLGTTHLCLEAGCPSLVVPMGWDQPLTGRQVHALRAGPPPVPAVSATPETLLQRFESLVHDPTWRRGARSAAERMRHDGGVTTGAIAVEQALSPPHRQAS